MSGVRIDERRRTSEGERAGQYATGWFHVAHLFCELKGKEIQMSTKEKTRELQEE